VRHEAGRVLPWLLLAVAVVVALGGWFSRPLPLDASALPAHEPDPANGERLFYAGGCASCHGKRLEGGQVLDTGFGRFHVPNISPDPGSGIGGWSDLDFLNAMQRGLSPDGRHLYPAFPYTSYTRMSASDLLDLKAWLDGFEPVSAKVPAHELKFPWNLRRGLGLWKRLYLDPSTVVDVDPAQPQQVLGRYLVEAVGHCGECHTPRDRLGGLERSRWLAGAPSLEGEGRVPNITPHEDGLADWSATDLERYFRTGFLPDYDTVGGAMVEVQENLARLDDEDRAAIAAYLAVVPPRPDADD